MFKCAKCEKRVEKVVEKMRVVHYDYELTFTCHGQTETKNVTFKQIKDAETSDVLVFVPVSPEKEKKAGLGTLGRGERVREGKAARS
jgi:hypothetical protein